MKFYSQEKNAFYAAELRDQYGENWPSDAIEVTEDEFVTYSLSQPPAGKQRGADASGRPTWVDIPETPLDTLAEQQRNAIDTARDAEIDAGFTHLFGTTEDVVQTRARDRENITGLAVSAQLMLTNGDTTSTLPFRAQSDTTYQLTAQEIVDLAQAAQQHVSAQYAKAWELKDQVETARKAGDRATLEAIAW